MHLNFGKIYDLNLKLMLLIIQLYKCSTSPTGSRNHLEMVKKQLQVFHFGNDSIIPFPQITIKNNIGNEIFEIIFSSFLSTGGGVKHARFDRTCSNLFSIGINCICAGRKGNCWFLYRDCKVAYHNLCHTCYYLALLYLYFNTAYLK